STHNLRELEGFCDHIGLLHKGGILLEKDIDSDSAGVYSVQFVINDKAFEKIKPDLNILKETHQGKLTQLTVKGNGDEINALIEAADPLFF
ncbi:MAG: ABC transporter ATP-binding protein, partial [Clostridiales bacterium]|nr:ABC transporter ATP-binding protein [Clostridiales bacterium]